MFVEINAKLQDLLQNLVSQTEAAGQMTHDDKTIGQNPSPSKANDVEESQA